MKLIGISGKAGAGKNAFAEVFHSYGYLEFSFAAAVKKTCAEAFGISDFYFHNRELKEEVHPYWNLSPRQMMQLLGTEAIRGTFGDDFWVRRLQFTFTKLFDSDDKIQVVIPDVRTELEANFILSNGGYIIHLTRPGTSDTVGIVGHSSEAFDLQTLLIGEYKDRIYQYNNDSTLAALKKQAEFYAANLYK